MYTKLKNLKSDKKKYCTPDQIFGKYSFWLLTLSGLGLSGPHHQFHSCYSETYGPIMHKSLWLLVFILKTYSEKIFAKLNNQGGCYYFFLEPSKKF